MITIKDYIQFIEDLECVDVYNLILKNLAKYSPKFQDDLNFDISHLGFDDLNDLHKLYRKLIRRKEMLDLYSDFIYNKSSTVN